VTRSIATRQFRDAARKCRPTTLLDCHAEAGSQSWRVTMLFETMLFDLIHHPFLLKQMRHAARCSRM